jgi:hypothetical protein
MKSNKDSKSINVYWASHSVPEDEGPIGNWNMLYHDPVNVFKHWTQFDIKDTKDKEQQSFINCPAFKNLSKNMYAWNWPIDCGYRYKAGSYDVNQIEIYPTTDAFMAVTPPRNQTMTIGPSVEFAYRLHMFAEEPLEVQLTGPYLQQVEYQKYGFLTSGQFDIGQWFRTLNVEIQLYGNEGEINFKKDEPIFYVNFLTDKKVNLIRFELTKEIDTYSRKCINAKHMYGYKMPLQKSYDIFRKTRTRDIVLKKIKENLI